MRRRKSRPRAQSAAGVEKNNQGEAPLGEERALPVEAEVEESASGVAAESAVVRNPRRQSAARPQSPRAAVAPEAEVQQDEVMQPDVAEEVAAPAAVDVDATAEPSELDAARARAAAGDAEAAIEICRAYIIRQPEDVDARLYLARLHEERNEPQLALEQYEAAREYAGERMEVLLGAAMAHASLRRFENAEKDLRRAVKAFPGRAEVFATAGQINFRRGLYAQAEQELKRTIELDPGNATAYFYRGESLNQLNRVDEALEMLEHATHLQPTNARAFYVMGIAFDKKGRPQEAAAMYRKSREVGAA